MGRKTTITLNLKVELFAPEAIREVTQHAKATGGKAYCWKTMGAENWLEGQFSQVNLFGYVVLPPGLPDYIEMPDDFGAEGEDEND